MQHHPRQPARDRPVHVLHDPKVRREEDVKEPLAHEGRGDGHGAPPVSRLHDGRVEAGHGVGEAVEVGQQQAVRGEAGGEDVEEGEEAGGEVLAVAHERRARRPRAQAPQRPGPVLA